MKGSPRAISYFKLHFLVAIWSLTAILGAAISVSPIALVFYRTLFSALILFGFLYFKRGLVRLELRPMLILFGTGALLAFHWILFFASARMSTVSVSLAGMSTASLWTSILEPLIYGRKIKIRDVFFGFLAMIGLYIIFKFEFNHFAGLVTSLLAAVVASLFVVANSRLVRKYDAVMITGYEMTGAALFSAIVLVAYLASPWGQGTPYIPVGADWPWLLVLTLVCTVYGYSLAAALMRQFTAFMMNLTVNLEPIYGIILAICVFGDQEKMTTGFYIGTSIIVISVLLYPIWIRYEKQNIEQKIARRKLTKRGKGM